MNCRFGIAMLAMALSCASYAQDVSAPAGIAPAETSPPGTVLDEAPVAASAKAYVVPDAAQTAPLPPPPAPPLVRIPAPPRTIISCESLGFYEAGLSALYIGEAPGQRLDRALLETALASYRKHNCANSTYGPSAIVVVDFAKKSNEPRLWLVDMFTGKGIDDPVLVTHGVGSDPNDDGMIDWFGNIKDSLTSSMGAVRGAEVYSGKNGRSLRLDGLDPTNSEIRRRDIVVHSVGVKKRTYFNAAYVADRNGIVGMSEGCFVVIPELRDWLIDSLSNGGFLYAGASGERGAALVAAAMAPPPPPVAIPQAEVANAEAQAPQPEGVLPAAPTEPVAPVTGQI